MKKPSVTIGICAYNEAQNIRNALRSVLRQKCRSFRLRKILVICDGSIDGTPDIVRRLQQKHPIISLKYHRERLGKTARLNELYEKNTGDYLFTLDGDVVLGTDREIEIVLDVARKTHAHVVAAHQIPCNVRGFVRRILYANHCLWTEVRMRVNGGNYIQNLQGSATLLRHDFTRTMRYPAGFVTDAGYLYILASRMNTFAFSPENKVLYQPLGTLRDWIRLNHRIVSKQYRLEQAFGSDIAELCEPPFKAKVLGISIAIRKDPIFTLIALILCYSFKLIMRFQKPTVTGLWPTLTSTKVALK